MADEPRELVRAEPVLPAESRELEEEREVRRLVAGVKSSAIRKAKKVIEAVDDATLLADIAEPKRSIPTRTAFVLKMAEKVLDAEQAQPAVQINISQQTILLPPRNAPDYSNAITVEPSDGDDD